MEILFKILQKKNNYPNGYNMDNAKDYLNKLTKNLIKEYDGNIGVNIYTDLLGKNIKKIEVEQNRFLEIFNHSLLNKIKIQINNGDEFRNSDEIYQEALNFINNKSC